MLDNFFFVSINIPFSLSIFYLCFCPFTLQIFTSEKSLTSVPSIKDLCFDLSYLFFFELEAMKNFFYLKYSTFSSPSFPFFSIQSFYLSFRKHFSLHVISWLLPLLRLNMISALVVYDFLINQLLPLLNCMFTFIDTVIIRTRSRLKDNFH